MRFKKGSIVEVFSTREVPSGTWYRAEVIHGNGHYYTIKYGISAVCEVLDRVPRKAIRPCAPMVVLDCAPGDVVEVFHGFSWRMVTVLRALQTGWLLVRLLGSTRELEVSEGDARPRLFWEDDEWTVIGKGSSNCEERQNVPSLLNNHNSRKMETTTSMSLKNSYYPYSNINSIQEGQDVSKSLKRKFKSCYPQSEEHAEKKQKIRFKGKDGRRNQLILQAPSPEKVDAVASSRAMPVEKCLHPFTNQLTGCSEKIMGRERMDGAVGCSLAISLDSRGVNSITSSVASCSVSKENTCQIPQTFRTCPFEENGDYSSDAESFCPNRSEEGNLFLPAVPNLTEEVHRIELHAYRSIIGALYASGPLSWEQETLLTDLRDSLHISNDEHLTELRSLVSSRQTRQ